MKEKEDNNNLINDTESKPTEENSENSKKEGEIIYWREECMKGNLMPGVLLLDQKKSF